MDEDAVSGKTVANATTALSARHSVEKLLNAAQGGDLIQFKEAANSIAAGQDLSHAVGDVKDANGRSSLHFAARGGNVELCKYLIEELHLPTDDRDSDGETPLIHAARLGNVATAQYLISHGADVSAASHDLGTTPLHHAAGVGCTELIKILLQHGAEVNVQSSCTGTPLIWASGHGNFDAVKLLLENGANPNANAENNVSALISASAAGATHLVGLLLDHGAEVNASAGGVTALHVAADIGDENIVMRLLECGANPNAKDEDGATPVEAAAAGGHRTVVECLLPKTTPLTAVNWTVDGLMATASSSSSQPHHVTTPTAQSQTSQEIRDKAAEANSRGSAAFKKKDYSLAIDAYTQALDLDPNNATTYCNRSICWIRKGQVSHALADAKAAVELKPDSAKAHYREGVALRLLERYEDAANAFYEGLEIEPHNEDLLQALREAVDSGKKFFNKSN